MPLDEWEKVVCKLEAIKLSTNALKYLSIQVVAVNKKKQTKANVEKVPSMEETVVSRWNMWLLWYQVYKGQCPAYGKTYKKCNNKIHFTWVCGQCKRLRYATFNCNNGPIQLGGNNYRGNQQGNLGLRGNLSGYRGGHQSCRNIQEVQTNDQLQHKFQEQSYTYSYDDYGCDPEPDWMVPKQSSNQSYYMNAITVVHDASFATKPDSSACQSKSKL